MFYPTERDIVWMREALREAALAAEAGEVPVGAVVEFEGSIVGRGHNCRETTHDPTAHAEILALREAARTLERWNLDGATLYVTVEPCPMCAGAIWMARIARLVYGVSEPKTGAVHSRYRLLSDSVSERNVLSVGGCLSEEAKALLTAFFESRRSSMGRDARAAESGGLENR